MEKEKPQNDNAVILGSFAKQKRLPQLFQRRRRLLVLGVGALVVIGAAAVGVKYVLDNQMALKIGKYSYTKKEYRQLISEASKLAVVEPDARQALIAGLAARSAADSLKLSYPTDQASLDEAAAEKYKVIEPIGGTADEQETQITTPPPSEYQRVTSYDRVIDPVLRVTEVGGYKAAIVSFPFSRYIIGSFENETTPASGYNPALLGNVDAIKQDMDYAKKAAEADRQAYINKTKTLNQIVSSVSSDPRLTYGQADNKSSVMLVTNDGNVESIYGTRTLSGVQYESITQAGGVGVPSALLEDVYDSSNSVAATVPGVKRDNGMLVAWYFVVVDQKIAKQEGITGRYNTLVKGYTHAQN